jgi:hypothetical protein
MADPEQPKQKTEEPKSPSPADGAQSSGQTKAYATGAVAPSTPKGSTVPSAATTQPPTVPANPPAPTPPPVSKKRFWINLVLCLFLVASAVFWFEWHLQYWFAGALAGGVVLVIVPVIYGVFTSIAGDEMKAFPAKVLGAKWSRRVIIILLGATLPFHFLTSSLNVEFAQADPGINTCTVEILKVADGQRFTKPLTVTSDDKFAGRLFFFHFFATELRFKLSEPAGHEHRVGKLRLARRILLRAPADFPAKQFHILRVVFGPRLWGYLAGSDDTTSASYDLQMSVGGKTIPIDDVRRETIYAGASAEEIKYVLKGESPSDRKNDFVEHLSELGCPAEQQQGWADSWQSNPRIVATDEHGPGEAITIALRRRGAEAPIARQEIKMTSFTIQTVVLEMQ